MGPPPGMREVCRRDKLHRPVVRTLKEAHIFVLNYIEVSVMLREAGWGFDLPLHTLDRLHLAVPAGSELPVPPTM
jgi:hypothetical protein